MSRQGVIGVWPGMVAGHPEYPGQRSFGGTPTVPLTEDRIASLRVHTKPCPDKATGLVALAKTVAPDGWAYLSATFGPDGAAEVVEPWYWAPTVDGVAAHVRLRWQRRALGLED